MMARVIRKGPLSDLIPTVRNYAHNRVFRERAASEEERYKKTLMELLANYGTESEEKHRTLTLPEPVEMGSKTIYAIKRQRRVGQSLNEDRATDFLKANGLYDECTVTYTVLNEDAILALNFSDKISDKDLKALYDEKETFAFIPITEEPS
jgi:hypothetical protein